MPRLLTVNHNQRQKPVCCFRKGLFPDRFLQQVLSTAAEAALPTPHITTWFTDNFYCIGNFLSFARMNACFYLTAAATTALHQLLKLW